MTTGDAAQDARRGWTPWLVGAVVLPVLGAAATVAVVENVELDTWEAWQAALLLAATFVVPAALSAWVAWSFGLVEAQPDADAVVVTAEGKVLYSKGLAPP